MPNSSTPLVHKDVDEAPKIPLIPSAIAAPLEGALSAVGGLASNGMAQVAERGQGLANGARPWMEFFDLSQFGLTGGGMNGYFERYRANFRYFFLNYFMIGMVLTVMNVVMKPIALIGLVFLCWVYFQLFGAATTGVTDVRFLGMELDVRERTGLMLVLVLLVGYMASSGGDILVTILTGTLLASLVHGCLRKPHPSAMPVESAV